MSTTPRGRSEATGSGRRLVNLIKEAYFSDYGYSSTPQVIIDAINKLSPDSAAELAGLLEHIAPSRVNTIITKVIREIKSVQIRRTPRKIKHFVPIITSEVNELHYIDITNLRDVPTSPEKPLEPGKLIPMISILTVIDAYSRYAEARILANDRAETARDTLIDIYNTSDLGIPVWRSGHRRSL